LSRILPNLPCGRDRCSTSVRPTPPRRCTSSHTLGGSRQPWAPSAHVLRRRSRAESGASCRKSVAWRRQSKDGAIGAGTSFARTPRVGTLIVEPGLKPAAACLLDLILVSTTGENARNVRSCWLPNDLHLQARITGFPRDGAHGRTSRAFTVCRRGSRRERARDQRIDEDIRGSCVVDGVVPSHPRCEPGSPRPSVGDARREPHHSCGVSGLPAGDNSPARVTGEHRPNVPAMSRWTSAWTSGQHVRYTSSPMHRCTCPRIPAPDSGQYSIRRPSLRRGESRRGDRGSGLQQPCRPGPVITWPGSTA
jgi:hypothetical protein